VGNRLADIVSASLRSPMELEFESIAKRALLIAKSAMLSGFLSLKTQAGEAKLRSKNGDCPQDWCELTSRTLNRVLELVLIEGDVDEAVEHVKKVISDIRNLDPRKDSEIIESLVLTRTLTRKTDSYKNSNLI